MNIHFNYTFGTKIERQIVDAIVEKGSDFSYSEHMTFINFTSYNVSRPIYVNMVRDPIERFASAFYYRRNPHVNVAYARSMSHVRIRDMKWFDMDFNECVLKNVTECQLKDLTIPKGIPHTYDYYPRLALFFCGNKENCLYLNSPLAVQMAKRNVEQEYAVVGSWEETNITLTVLEKYVPRFFDGIGKLYETDKKIHSKNKNIFRKGDITPEVRSILKDRFRYEIEFYEFCKQRLFRQYEAVKSIVL